MADLTIEGLDEVAAALTQVAEAIPTRTAAASQVTAQRIAAHMRAIAPVRTGRLRASITPATLSDGAASVTVGVPYWLHVEFGTARMSARPFARPAAEAERAGHEQRIEAALDAAIHRFAS